jgi:glycosyltransferase involved in cell wall biosynthesis
MITTSFVIPVYNRKRHIINTLAALNFQDGHDQSTYEVIVVDDGSDDNLYESIRGINQNYQLKYFYLPKDEDSCLSRARNHGWKNAEGELIAFIDCDIIVRSNYLNEVDRYYAAEKDLLLMGLRLMLQEEVTLAEVQNGRVFDQWQFNGRNFEVCEHKYHLLNQYSYNTSALKYPWLKVFGNNLVIPKAWLEKIGGFDEDYKGWGTEDVDLGYKAYTSGIKIFINSRLEVLHQYHGEGNDIVDQNKFVEYERNINCFIDKYPHALELPRDFIIDLFKGKADIDLSVDEEKPVARKVIDLKNQASLNEIKALIIQLSHEKQLEIIVNDYLEKTDLDLWIQCLGRRSSTPKYFPVSKKFKK